ncbi:molybdenum cofactor guanylyltransferase, partial [Singulisphaera rosea]
GPLQGLAAGFAAFPTSVDFIYASATDLPFLQPGWFKLLERLIAEDDLAIPFVDGYHHPFAALYRRSAVQPAVDTLLLEGRRRILDLLDRVRTRLISADELRIVDPSLHTLRNLNSPEEYQSALAELGMPHEQ